MKINWLTIFYSCFIVTLTISVMKLSGDIFWSWGVVFAVGLSPLLALIVVPAAIFFMILSSILKAIGLLFGLI